MFYAYSTFFFWIYTELVCVNKLILLSQLTNEMMSLCLHVFFNFVTVFFCFCFRLVGACAWIYEVFPCQIHSAKSRILLFHKTKNKFSLSVPVKCAKEKNVMIWEMCKVNHYSLNHCNKFCVWFYCVPKTISLCKYCFGWKL